MEEIDDDHIESNEPVVSDESVQESVSSSRSTKRPLSSKRKPSQISKEDDAINVAIGVLKKAQTKNEEDSFDVFGKYIAHELRLLKNKFSQNWAKFKIQEVLYQAKVTSLSSQTPKHIHAIHQSNTFMQEVLSPEYTPLNPPVYNGTSFSQQIVVLYLLSLTHKTKLNLLTCQYVCFSWLYIASHTTGTSWLKLLLCILN